MQAGQMLPGSGNIGMQPFEFIEMKILVVEDETDLLNSLAKALRETIQNNRIGPDVSQRFFDRQPVLG